MANDVMRVRLHLREIRVLVLLVDETSMRKRHRYVTVIVNGDTGRTLAMVEHRNAAALSGFLRSQPHKWRRGVKVVVSDGSKAYKASVQACLRRRAMCWTASVSSDGSQPGSVRCAATSGAANQKASNPPSTQKCSEPASC